MGSQRLDKIRDLFLIARALPPDRRAAALADQCADDQTLVAEVLELLAADQIASLLPETVIAQAPVAAQRSSARQPTSPQSPVPPDLDGYTIVNLLGQGGMGTVWKAIQASTNRPVALKLMNASLFASTRARARFVREVELAARLQHPNITRIYDSGLNHGIYYYAMELIEGEPLDQFIARRKLSERHILALMRRICRGLQHAHEKGVIHRDLKPGNILVDREAQPHILDFGIAKPIAEDASRPLTFEGEVAGTPAYMSPEQIRAETIDSRSDIFSFGVVLYEVLAGHRPFSGQSNAEITAAILRDPPSPFTSSPAVAAIAHRCLHKSPDGRFQSMDHVRAALKDASVATDLKAPSIAVLPFANMSNDPADEYFADGLAEEIINALTHVEKLKVIARTSAFAFKGRNQDIRKIARTLGVDHVLEGSVRRAGNRLRITAQLIHASDGAHLWSHRYDREMIDVFAVQDEIAAAITQQLKVSLSPRTGQKRHIPDVAAYEALLQARHHWHRFSTGGWTRALECLERALSIDPDYAAAHAGIASYYAAVAWAGIDDPRQVMPKARASAERALSLDDSFAEAHAILGVVAGVFEYDWPRAANHFARALELDRASPDVCVPYAIWYLRPLYRLAEALAELNSLRERDPLSVMARTESAHILFLMREFAQSGIIATQALELEPNHSFAQFQLIRMNIGLKKFNEAVVLAEQSVHANKRWFVSLAHLAAAYAYAGRVDDAQRVVAEMHDLGKGMGYLHATPFATTYAALGQIDTAVQWVERAIAQREPIITTLKSWPVFDPIRSHPRYPNLLHMMNLQ